MFKLYHLFNKFYVINKDSTIPSDYDVAWEIGMSLGEYREFLIYKFKGKQTNSFLKLDVKSNNIYFKFEEEVTLVLDWLNSMLVANRLSGKKKDSSVDEWLNILKHK